MRDTLLKNMSNSKIIKNFNILCYTVWYVNNFENTSPLYILTQYAQI